VGHRNAGSALPGSVGTPFRAPPATTLEGRVTPLQFFGGNYRPVDIESNPTLSPESALEPALVLVDAELHRLRDRELQSCLEFRGWEPPHVLAAQRPQQADARPGTLPARPAG